MTKATQVHFLPLSTSGIMINRLDLRREGGLGWGV